MKLFRQCLFVAVLATMFTSFWTTTTAQAATLQDEVNKVLEEFGGIQIAPNAIAWNGREIILEIRNVESQKATAAVNNCPDGSFCAFDAGAYSGNRLMFTACPTTVTTFPGLSNVRSLQNSRATGTVRAYSSTILRATLNPGKGAPLLPVGITKLTCS